MSVCSHKLFGYNLECTRRLGYGGIYAEMLHNSRMLNGASGYYPVAFEDLQGLGQCTERIHLLSGTQYRWKVQAGEKVIVRILTEFGQELFRTDMNCGVFTSRYNCPWARFEVVSDGPVRYASLKPSDAWHECRRDVLDAIAELRPCTIRVPGGCFSEEYHWKDGLLPIEERPPILGKQRKLLFPSHENYDGYELNVDDYAAICRYVGAEMEYTVRVADNEPSDAADVVEYCNGDSSTRFGALRASRGYPDPYNVRTWYVGNEMATHSHFLITHPEEAARLNDLFSETMLKADPTIRLVASTGVKEFWDDQFVQIAKYIDLYSQHNYLIDAKPDWTVDYVLREGAEYVRALLERASRRCGRKEVLLDEWNMRWGASGDSLTALYAASVMTMLIRSAETLNVVGATYFAPVNEGAIRVYPDHVRFAPDGEVLRRMVIHAGGTLAPCEDKTCVQTVHDGFTYTSVYNDSATQEKKLGRLSGEYELLTPNGVWMNIERGEGTLGVLPPASIAFFRS